MKQTYFYYTVERITCRPIYVAIVLIMEDHVRIINFEIFARNIAKDNRLGLEVNG